MSSKIKTILLKDSEWLRGKEDSALLREDGRRCCIGIACSLFGVGDSNLAVPGIGDLPRGLIPKELLFLMDYSKENTRISKEHEMTPKLYLANDEMPKNKSDEDRVAELNALLQEYDAPIRFKFVANT